MKTLHVNKSNVSSPTFSVMNRYSDEFFHYDIYNNGVNGLIENGLFENLQMIGITPEQIDIILLTHMHGDHIGSLLDEKGKASFPNAEVYLAKPEHDYWIKTEDRNSTVKTVINTYKNKLHLFEPTELGKKIENLPDGFESMSAYGHTPGHTAYLIGMGKEKMLIWGDLTHAMAIQMPYPQVAVTYDTDPNGAIASRKRILEYVFRNNIPIGGMHIAFPGMGKITREGKGYIFIPMIEQKKK